MPMYQCLATVLSKYRYTIEARNEAEARRTLEYMGVHQVEWCAEDRRYAAELLRNEVLREIVLAKGADDE